MLSTRWGKLPGCTLTFASRRRRGRCTSGKCTCALIHSRCCTRCFSIFEGQCRSSLSFLFLNTAIRLACSAEELEFEILLWWWGRFAGLRVRLAGRQGEVLYTRAFSRLVGYAARERGGKQTTMGIDPSMGVAAAVAAVVVHWGKSRRHPPDDATRVTGWIRSTGCTHHIVNRTFSVLSRFRYYEQFLKSKRIFL